MCFLDAIARFAKLHLLQTMQTRHAGSRDEIQPSLELTGEAVSLHISLGLFEIA